MIQNFSLWWKIFHSSALWTSEWQLKQENILISKWPRSVFYIIICLCYILLLPLHCFLRQETLLHFFSFYPCLWIGTAWQQTPSANPVIDYNRRTDWYSRKRFGLILISRKRFWWVSFLGDFCDSESQIFLPTGLGVSDLSFYPNSVWSSRVEFFRVHGYSL